MTVQLKMHLKRRIHRVADHLAATTGLLARQERRLKGAVTLLMYHRVLPDEQCPHYPHRSLATPASAFREQVRFLADHYHVVPVKDALSLLDNPSSEKPCVCLTFDDGYDDNHRLAAPILEEAGLRGTFYITSGIIAGHPLFWFDRAVLLWQREAAQLSRQLRSPSDDFEAYMQALKMLTPQERQHILDRYPDDQVPPDQRTMYRTMTIDNIRDLIARGHEIGSHTLTHPLLPQLYDEEIVREVTEARRQLQQWTGDAIPGFCYPNGDYNELVLDAVRQAGYTYACTTQRGTNRPGMNRHLLRRMDMNPRRVTWKGRHDPLAFRRQLSRDRK